MGLTVMVNVCMALVHPLRVAVAVMVPVTFAPVRLEAVVKLISPLFGPALIPMAGLELDHVMIDPGTFEVQLIVTGTPGQYT